MTTTTKDRPKFGTKEWKDIILVNLRKAHGLADDADVRIKTFSADIKAENEDDPYKFTALINTAGLDRDDEVVLPKGMDASEFDASGAIFWNHSYETPVAIAGRLSQDDKGVIGRAEFMKRPDDWQGEWFPDFARAFVTQMRKAGKSAGVSIGFIPLERRAATKKDKEQFGERCTSVVTRWKMLEWSIAPVQANPEAVVTMVGKGLIDRKVVKAVEPDLEIPEKIEVAAPQAEKVVKRPQERIVIVVSPPAKKFMKPDRSSIVPGIAAKAAARATGRMWY